MKPTVNRLLKRQLRRLMVEDFSTLTPEKWETFLTCISQAYDGFDRDRYLMERSISISSEEMRVMDDVRSQAAAAEAASEAKSAFLAIISHEMRTPLNGVIGFNQLLETTDLNEEQLPYVEKISTSASHLLDLINDVLDCSQVEAGKLHLESIAFDPCDVIRSLLDLFADRVDRTKIEFMSQISPQVPKLVLGDPLRLKQILTNLIGNAVKFTREGSITIACRVIESSEAAVSLRFDVTDTGIGIPADKIKHVFEPFGQADSSTTRQYGGTGLGLTICRQLVDLMNGEISAESEPDRGSSFWFTCKLGITQPASTASEQFERAEQAGEVCHILLAEDDDVSSQVASRLLEKMGHCCTRVGNGREAFEAVKNHDYDLILMDCRMPEMDGLDATRAIREWESSKARATPIIALTANAFDSDRERCLAAGMDMHLSKPLDLNALKSALAQILNENHCSV